MNRRMTHLMSCGYNNEQKNTNKFEPQPLAWRKNKFSQKI